MRCVLALALAVGCNFTPGAVATGSGSGPGSDAGAGTDTAVVADSSRDASALPDAPAWAYKRMLTIDNTGLAALTDYPLLVILDASHIRYSAAGADLRFTDAGGTQLAFEIESWNPGGNSFVWVRVPTIAAGTTTTLWMYYDNPNAQDGQMATAVWDSAFTGVWHLVDAHDSTGKNVSSNHGGTSTGGKIGQGLAFDGLNHYVDTGSNAHLTTFTIEAWVKAAAAPRIVSNGSSIVARFENYLMLWDCNASTFCQTVIYDGANSNVAGTYVAGYTATAGTWTYVAGTYNGAALTAYVGGTQTGQQAVADPPLDVAASATIGIRQDLAGPFTGAIDEVRISSVARSPSYLQANAKAAAGTYVTIGAELAN